MDVAPHWQDAIASLARLSPGRRLIRLIEAPGGDPPDVLAQLTNEAVVERVQGREAVCEPFRFEVAVLSSSAELDLAPLLGQALGLRLDGPVVRTWYGVCTEVGLTGSDGGLARYTLVIEPFTALLRLRRNALIFQDLDVQGIVARVLDDHPLSAFRWEVTQPLPVRAITTQYREDDFAFLQRLLADAGLAWHFEIDDAAPAGHAWVIRDREAAVADVGAVRFHRIDATESDDAITVFRDRLQAAVSNRVVSSWQTTQVSALAAQAEASADGLPGLEAFTDPRAGRFADTDQAQFHADLQLDALRVGRQVQAGAGSARQLAPGAAFTLTGHESHGGRAFVVLAIEHSACNNFDGGIEELLARLDRGLEGERSDYRNRFVAVPTGTPIVPLEPPPVRCAGPQTARVVGLSDAAVSPSRDHQVRIQFTWQRGVQPNAGGLSDAGSSAFPGGHAPGDATSGTWVPVAEWLAGPNWGSHFLPRIGSEVLVEFLHGDLDQPRITGQLYNGEVAPPFALASASNHPGTISGLHSQAHDGGDSQQWVVDDATGQLRNRLHTSLADSRLELGYLIEHSDSRRGGLRGQGFELATRGWGNVHSPQGVLLSTTARSDGVSTQMDVAEAAAQFKGAERTAQALHETAQQQQVPGFSGNTQQTKLRESIDPDVDGRYAGPVNGQPAAKPDTGSREGSAQVARFALPVLVAESPDRVAWTTPASALAFAGGDLHMTSQDDAHLAAGETFAAVSGRHGALLAQAGQIRAIAANGPVTLQAHTGPLELLADQSVTVTASDERIDVLAKEKIVLQAGQTRVTLEGGDITFECPGEFTVKASQHLFMGGESNAARPIQLPIQLAPKMKYRGKLRLVDTNGKPMPDIYYKIVTATGEVLASGVTDDTGRSITVTTEEYMPVTAYLGQGGWSIEESVLDADEGCGC
jgi:type VI secretion system secreted protein VgrG